MLDVSPENLLSEIKAGEELRAKRLSRWSDMIRDYHGNAYDGDQSFADRQENTAFEVIAGINPQIVFSNPRVKLTSTRPEYQPLRVQGLEYAVNRWIRDTNPRLLYEELVVDFQFGFGVCVTRPARHNIKTERNIGDDYDDPPHRPLTERIDPQEFICDPMARTFRSAQWMGHPVTKFLDELEDAPEDEGWNKDTIANLKYGEGREAKADRSSHKPEDLARKDVTFWEIWAPGYELEESEGSKKGFHGTWLTVTTDGKELRKPRPAFVPRWGPYTFFGAYTVPGQQHPLGLIPALRGLDDQLNRTAQANLEAIERHKEIVAVEESETGILDAVEQVPTGGVVGLRTDDIRNKIVPLSLGGVTSEGLQGEAVLRDRRDRGVGLQDAQRGEVSGVGTATEQVIAQQSSNIRIAHLQQKFQIDGVQQHLRTVAWFLDADDRTVMYLGPAAVPAFGPDPVYIGGLYDGAKQRYGKEFPQRAQDEPMGEEDDGYRLDDFDLLEIELEPYSMIRADDPGLQARAMQGMSVAAQIAPLVVQAPWMDWKTILDRVGDSMNWPDYGSVVNEPMAAAVANQMMQQQLVQPQPNIKGRMAGDLGKDAKVPSRANPFGLAVG